MHLPFWSLSACRPRRGATRDADRDPSGPVSGLRTGAGMHQGREPAPRRGADPRPRLPKPLRSVRPGGPLSLRAPSFLSRDAAGGKTKGATALGGRRLRLTGPLPHPTRTASNFRRRVSTLNIGVPRRNPPILRRLGALSGPVHEILRKATVPDNIPQAGAVLRPIDPPPAGSPWRAAAAAPHAEGTSDLPPGGKRLVLFISGGLGRRRGARIRHASTRADPAADGAPALARPVGRDRVGADHSRRRRNRRL